MSATLNTTIAHETNAALNRIGGYLAGRNHFRDTHKWPLGQQIASAYAPDETLAVLLEEDLRTALAHIERLRMDLAVARGVSRSFTA